MSSLGGLLRRRLVLGLLITLGLSGVGASLIVRRALTAQFDAALLAKARLFATVIKADADGDVTLDLDETPMPEFGRGEHPEYYQAWRSDGSVMARSPSLGPGRLHAPTGADPAFEDLPLPAGREGRAVTLKAAARFDDDEAPPPGARAAALPVVGFAVARDRRPLDEAIAGTSLALGVGGLLVLIGMPLLVSGAVRRGLRPLDALGGKAALIHAASLGQRFSVDGVPDELLPICRRLNDLLERLEGSFDRERRFSADVAHELRTPIAELRTVTEVALRFPGGEEEDTAGREHEQTALSERTRRSLDEILTTALSMEALVTSLLTLSRCDSGRQPVTIQPVDLGRMCDELWPPHQRTAKKKGVQTVACGCGSAMVNADPVLLGSVVQNLFSNAVEYTAAGGEVAWSITHDEQRTALVVTNSNTSLTADDLPHVFERFWRKDPARTGGSHGGLGLSLGEAFVRLMRGTLRLELPRPDLVRVELALPSVTQPAPSRNVFIPFSS